MTTSKEFNDLIIKQSGDQIVRFKDIGRAELGPEDIRGILKRDGVPMVGVHIIPQPGSNQIEIVDEVYRRLEFIRKDLPDDVKVKLIMIILNISVPRLKRSRTQFILHSYLLSLLFTFSCEAGGQLLYQYLLYLFLLSVLFL